jgi:YkoY family integral membrane protein
MLLAFIFRFAAIFGAALLLRYTVVKLLGGGYLVYIAVRHLFFEAKKEEDEHIVLDEQGHPHIVHATGTELPPDKQEADIKERVPVYIKGEGKKSSGYANFWPTVGSIGLTDIAFAVDSILAAIALIGAPKDPTNYHPKLWVVFAGALLGMVALRFAAGLVIKLLEKFPRFEIAAYLLVLVIGTKLLLDWGCNSDWSIGWPRSPAFEAKRLALADHYESWLEHKWIFKIKHDQGAHKVEPPASENSPPNEGAPVDDNAPIKKELPPKEKAASIVPPHHLLDFHDPRRPEFILFWVSMLAALCSGFIPPRKKTSGAAK